MIFGGIQPSEYDRLTLSELNAILEQLRRKYPPK